MPLFEEYIAEIAPLWESRWLTNSGGKHRALEAALRDYLGVRNVALFTNGHLALECALEALGLGEDGRDEVITTPFTFVSTTNAIVRRGLKPVMVDVKPGDLTMDPALAEAAVTPRTCAIVPVHVYGGLCDADAIDAIAKRHGLKVVYDAAHAFGVERLDPATGQWRGAASFGDASMLSFHATKVFNTIEGGAVCFAGDALGERLARLRNFGLSGPEGAEYVGGNAKMNEFCAAMGLCNLRHVDEEIAKRKVVAEAYWERLRGLPGLTLLEPPAGVRPNYAYFPVLFGPGFAGGRYEGRGPSAARDAVCDALATQGIGARKYFYPLTSDFACHARRFAPSAQATPVAARAAERVLTLPLYADLAAADVDRICWIVEGCGR